MGEDFPLSVEKYQSHIAVREHASGMQRALPFHSLYTSGIQSKMEKFQHYFENKLYQ